MSYNIVFIGSGNVATHLSQGLKSKGFNIKQVFSRKITKARKLAKILNCTAVNKLDQINPTADLYVLAVHDDAIASVAEQLSKVIGKDRLVVHTSGSISSTVLKNHFKSYGIFYPLQTMSIGKAVNLAEVPFCVHSNRKTFREKLFKIAGQLSEKVYRVSDDERAKLHVAAVFVNNFSNHLYYIAQQLVEKEDLNFEILKPLISETARKIQDGQPYKMQTGPARRGDDVVIQKHLDYLKTNKEFSEIYKLLSSSILKTYKKK